MAKPISRPINKLVLIDFFHANLHEKNVSKPVNFYNFAKIEQFLYNSQIIFTLNLISK